MSDVRGPATGVSGYVESLKRDRDRYLALAFCAADLLVEVGSGGKIHFCAGAAQSLLGVPPEELIGRQFDSVLTEADKALVKEVMSRLAPGARIDPVQLRLTGESGPTAPLTLMGYHLPDQPGQFYLAFRVGAPEAAIDGEFDAERDLESGLLQKEAFAKLASRQIKQARDRGETLKFTVMKVPELAGALLAAVVGNALGAVSVSFLDHFTLFDYAFRFSGTGTLLISALCVVTCLVAAIYPSLVALRSSSAESLHYE